MRRLPTGFERLAVAVAVVVAVVAVGFSLIAACYSFDNLLVYQGF